MGKKKTDCRSEHADGTAVYSVMTCTAEDAGHTGCRLKYTGACGACGMSARLCGKKTEDGRCGAGRENACIYAYAAECPDAPAGRKEIFPVNPELPCTVCRFSVCAGGRTESGTLGLFRTPEAAAGADCIPYGRNGYAAVLNGKILKSGTVGEDA